MNAHLKKNLLKALLRRQQRLGLLKLFLLVGAFLTLVLIFFGSTFFESKHIIEENSGDAAKEATELDKKQLLNPRFEGLDEKNQPFVVEAHLATQVSDDLVNLIEPKGNISLLNGEQMMIEAHTGKLTDQNRKLDLEGDVKFNHIGCVVMTDKAHADLETKSVESHTSTFSQCPEGEIQAGGFILQQEKGSLIYTDRPHLVLQNQ